MFITLRVQPAEAGVSSSVFFSLRSIHIPRGRRLFGILQSSFSQHITPMSAIRYLPLFIQPTHRTGVGYSFNGI